MFLSNILIIILKYLKNTNIKIFVARKYTKSSHEYGSKKKRKKRKSLTRFGP